MTERILSQAQAAEIGYLRGIHGVTLLDKARRCEFYKARNVKLLLLRRENPSCLDRTRDQNVSGKTGETSCWPHTHGKAAQQRSTKE